MPKANARRFGRTHISRITAFLIAVVRDIDLSEYYYAGPIGEIRLDLQQPSATPSYGRNAPLPVA
jgi:hypothetical protein